MDFIYHFAVRQNFTIKDNFTHEVNFTSQKGKLHRNLLRLPNHYLAVNVVPIVTCHGRLSLGVVIAGSVGKVGIV